MGLGFGCTRRVNYATGEGKVGERQKRLGGCKGFGLNLV